MPKQIVTKATERRIFTTDPVDIAAATLAELGLSNRCIRQRCGINQQGKQLSDSMIAYRLKFAKVDRKAFRDGTSIAAKLVIKTVSAEVEREVMRRVKGSK